MALDYRKYEFKREKVLKDPRNHFEKFKDKIRNPETGAVVFALTAAGVGLHEWFMYVSDLLLFYNSWFFIWLIFYSRKYNLPFKMPKSANQIDPNNKAPGSGKSRPADGILYIGNEEKTNEEIWFTNTDARTHILYLGTTGSGKTEGLKSMATNALGWGSGFIYVDGKADTDLWGSISAMARRYGRDDDLLVLNYMTGNSDGRIASNTINPFAQGSASYLTNLLVSLMPEVQGDNAMWKDRAVALVSALMPVLTWQRNNQEKVLNITTIRDSLLLKRIIQLSRLTEVPERLRKGLMGYLDTLPGFVESAYNDDGTQKPNPSGPPIDYSTVDQQHGYLAMQFTRQLQSLADDYGYIFETPSADIDMMDVVLNRRIVVVLIPALEKSADETANLGKIVGSMLKGMMGATLGSTIEGDTDVALENKPTRSSTPFMAVFDEVGYYTTQGMAVMAAQARSLGFCLIFAGQDLPAMEKRVKEEARSIVANCNLKIFGKLEDPTQTKEFFEKTVGESTVLESSTRKQVKAMFGQKKFDDTENYSVTTRAKASYDQLKSFKEGQSIVSFGDRVVQAKMFYSNVGKIKSLRVNKFITMPHPDPDSKRSSVEVDAILERMRDKKWTAAKAVSKTKPNSVLDLLKQMMAQRSQQNSMIDAASFALTQLGFAEGIIGNDDVKPVKALEAKPVIPAAATPVLTAPTEDDLQILKAPTAQLDKELVAAREPEAANQPGVEETISWTALLGEETPAVKTTPTIDEATGKKIPDLESMPTIEESVSWKDLIGEGDASSSAPTAVAKSGDTPPPAMPTHPGGFGVGGFGTGFGGIGGMGGVAFPSGRYGGLGGGMGGGMPPATPPAAPKQPAIEEKIEKALNEGETINWKDLF